MLEASKGIGIERTLYRTCVWCLKGTYYGSQSNRGVRPEGTIRLSNTIGRPQMSFIETSDGDYLNLAEVRQLRPQRDDPERLIANTKDNGQIDAVLPIKAC